MFKKIPFLFFSFLILPATLLANSADNPYPFYVGASTGYGSTNWDGLVNQDSVNYPYVETSAPSAAQDKGLVYGLFAGYNFTKNFAVEFRYIDFPTATVVFGPPTNYNANNVASFQTSTYTYSLVGKVITPIGESPFSVFADAGLVYTHRSDVLANSDMNAQGFDQGMNGKKYNYGGMFGAGLYYQLTQHLFTGFEGTYGSGYGQSIEYPAKTYIPFTYAIQIEMGYRFAL